MRDWTWFALYREREYWGTCREGRKGEGRGGEGRGGREGGGGEGGREGWEGGRNGREEQ